MPLKEELKQAMKASMRSGDRKRLGAIRLIQAEIKRIEVDERIEVDDARRAGGARQNAQATSRLYHPIQ